MEPKPIKYRLFVLLKLSSYHNFINTHTLNSMMRNIEYNTNRKCYLKTLEPFSPVGLQLMVELKTCDLKDLSIIYSKVHECFSLHNLQITYSEDEIIAEVDGDISTLLPINTANFTLFFLSETKLTNINKLIGPFTLTLHIEKCHYISGGALSLYEFINNDTNLVFCKDGIEKTPLWLGLAYTARFSKMTTPAYQTLLLKNGLKQYATY